MNSLHFARCSAFRHTHGFWIIAAAILAGAVPAVAQNQPEEPAAAVKKVGNYVFKPIEIRPSPNGATYEGRFLFINKESSPVEIFGFDEPLDGKFEPQYPAFRVLKDGEWKEFHFGHCGTGAQQFAMQPGKEYEFITGLWGFDEQDAPLTGKIGVTDYWSEPFVLDWKKDRSAGKFDLARKENFEKVRAGFAKAGFKQELLAGDDFCTRLLQAMMKETLAKDMVDSFHPFAGKLDVVPSIQLNGSIRIDFVSDEVRDNDTEFRGWFVLDPHRFSPEWFRTLVKQHVEVGEWGEGVQMELDGGSHFDAPFYLSINYVPFDHAKRPSKEDSEKLFRQMLGVLDGWLK
jgi:hypothetical protein